MIPVSKNSQLRAYWNSNYASPLTRQYSAGALLATAANSSSPNAPAAIYSSGLNQTGDPRANSSGFWSVTAGGGAAALANSLGMGGASSVNIGGSSYTSGDGVIGNWIPIALLVLVLFLFLRK